VARASWRKREREYQYFGADYVRAWLARTALLFQLTYKSHTDAARLLGYCEQRTGDEDFFIRKAMGWALREYSKTDGPAVLTAKGRGGKQAMLE